MSWRVVIISKRSKVDFKMNYIVVREGLDEQRVFIDEISVLIIESTAVSLTTYVLCELLKCNVSIIFCDHNKNPIGELLTYYGTSDTTLKIRKQTSWSSDIKGRVWKQIVKNKISNQMAVMKACKNCQHELSLMKMHVDETKFDDLSNREGTAAKLFFKTMYGSSFTREDVCFTNSMLNYGYSLILSCVSREIVLNGYLTQIGIKHCKSTNSFNLSCDLVEPFRAIIDYLVYKYEGDAIFDTSAKRYLLRVFDINFIVEGQKHKILSAIHYYVLSVFKALNFDTKQYDIINIDYEL